MTFTCRRSATLPWIALIGALIVNVGGLTIDRAQAAPPHRRLNDDDAQWQHYGGDAGGTRHAASRQITAANVDQLEIAWTVRTGELGVGFMRADKLSFEATPILVDDTLYLSTPTDIVIALDAATGKFRWRHDPKIPRHLHYAEATSRGVTWWTDESADANARCGQRIFIGTLDARLIALDARDGAPCIDFGSNGSVDLIAGARATKRGEYLVTSPPAVYGDLIITGSAIGDNRGVELERGIVRAFDARTAFA